MTDDFPTGGGSGYRVVFDGPGWTVLRYVGAFTRRVPRVGHMSRSMARVIASRMAHGVRA